MVERPHDRPRVDQLHRIDPGRRARGDVAHVVGPGTERHEPELGKLHHHLGPLRGGHFPDLKIGAGGDIGVAGATRPCDPRHALKLMGREDPARDAQPAHERLQGRADEEQPVPTAEEVVDGLGKHRPRRPFGDLVPAIQPMLRALRLVPRLELAATGQRRVLGRAQRAGRLAGLALGGRAQQPVPDLHPGHEALEMLALLRCERLVVHHAASWKADPKRTV